ncbi:MAG: glycosyltransferase family 9 protein [Bdellovibrionales bacterium]|nr:glycosyltransferase family 9 protein [Bdellovibrionales bacterium]
MNERFLVIQTAFIGDAILSLPFLFRLCELHPHAEIDIVATPATHRIFTIAKERGLTPWAAHIHVHAFDKRAAHRGFRPAARFMRELRARSPHSFTAAFCLQRSLRSAVLAWWSGASERIGFSSGSAAFLYNRLVRRDWESGRSEVEKNLDLLRAHSGQVEEWAPRKAPSLLRNPKLPSRPADLLGAPVVLSLGSPWPTKRWPVENAAEMCTRLTREGIDVHLVGDPAAVPLGAEVKRLVPSLLLKDLTGQTDLMGWIDAIQSARMLVSGDSAAVHVASDLNVPVLALFGPTLPEFGFAPWRRNSLAVGLDDLACRPCHIHGPKKCPLTHHRCLKDLKGPQVWKALQAILDDGQSSG